MTALKIISTDSLYIDNKKNSNYSVILSIIAHAFVLISVKYVSFGSNAVPAPQEENYVDLGYQTFDEVPEAKPVKVETAEIQDQNSEVQSLQKEKPRDVASSPSSQTTYADVPYYKIKPKYPKDALEAGQEGFVNMTIDILEDGSVDNIKVTGGEKINTFESAALRSVAKWKYKPFTDEKGNPIRKTNYLVRVDFKIKEELAK